ncbi:hypothetical protein [Xanthomonas translucens]|uniref:hypothetical protein n=1 Tax=Xanthomonas campestris pv. translucens TaxID=343 RepID=UPI000B1595C4|nr:hypothetical protein [Xanthomonas translucens]QEO27212.1 hypothetical protein F0H32_14300 [Xanthomonas translucens pv. undulosa]WLA07578.1 hypothetical protein MO328_14310 [Xanthomonas translucens]
MKKILALAFLSVTSVAQSQPLKLEGQFGTLVYSNKKSETYDSIVYEKKQGGRVKPFEDSLIFTPEAQDLSPDRSYAVVNFSEHGNLEGGGKVIEQSKYMCAFIRMSDGCVVRVEEGEICGGTWENPSKWTTPGKNGKVDLESSTPKAVKIYSAYASGHKDGSQVSVPRILAYLPEGTTIDNLLACDPPTDSNAQTYSNFFMLLKRDGDIENAEKVRFRLGETNSRENLNPDKSETDHWLEKKVTSDKAYLYSSPDYSGETKGYLVAGDIVSVFPSPTDEPFLKAKYKQKNGKTIIRWIRRKDTGM